MSSRPRIALGYERLALELEHYIEDYVPQNKIEPISAFAFVPLLQKQDAQDLLKSFKADTLEEHLKNPESGLEIVKKIKEKTYLHEAIINYFEQGEYKDAMKLRLGVVGYCPPAKFDVKKAEALVNQGYNRVVADFPDTENTVVSGLTNVGVLKIAYEQAKRRGWRTAGVACEKVYEFQDNWFPVDEKPVIIGENWGDESQTFLETIDVLLRVGGGIQSIREAIQTRAMGKPVYEYELEKIE
ncbi:hypothetical protein AYK26_00205 [Euryarchaeota archaeon SM23-78]|nr:MAG: hypothetical protein AYK26_00205 [Euryarchaeota archaeon SM23-78]MBW3000500.1 hypothetical protein [Candidatus Woesearchaeota archaeon]